MKVKCFAKKLINRIYDFIAQAVELGLSNRDMLR